MKLLLLPISVICICILSTPTHARMGPVLSPVSAPFWPLKSLSISPSPATMAPASLGVQVKKVNQHRHMDKELFLAIVVISAVVASITLASFCILICLWKNLQISDDSDLKTVQTSGLDLKMNCKKDSVSVIEYASIEAATIGFNETNVLGEGGFGRIYKAHFSGNFLAAVKRLDSGREDLVKEFENEVHLMNQIQHPNIVSLLGYCVRGQTRLLVYELMPYGSLETQLHGNSHGSALSWHIRMKIALDIARGLEYLHDHCDPPVIHRDLKSSNILLDSSFNAKLSDFGLAITGDQNRSNLKLSGTVGYVAPEYLLDGKLTEKSDVYAFGVVLLELLMGKKPIEQLAPSQCQSIITWAMPQLTDRLKLPNVVDPVIRSTMDLKHLYQVAAVAVLCVQPEPSYRPLITDVLHSLIPLVPIELSGTLRVTKDVPQRAH